MAVYRNVIVVRSQSTNVVIGRKTHLNMSVLGQIMRDSQERRRIAWWLTGQVNQSRRGEEANPHIQ